MGRYYAKTKEKNTGKKNMNIGQIVRDLKIFLADKLSNSSLEMKRWPIIPGQECSVGPTYCSSDHSTQITA